MHRLARMHHIPVYQLSLLTVVQVRIESLGRVKSLGLNQGSIIVSFEL
jgi:hypothetical protein